MYRRIRDDEAARRFGRHDEPVPLLPRKVQGALSAVCTGSVSTRRKAIVNKFSITSDAASDAKERIDSPNVRNVTSTSSDRVRPCVIFVGQGVYGSDVGPIGRRDFSRRWKMPPLKPGTG